MNSSMARVVSVQPGAPVDRAVVEVDAIIACARCAEGKGCGAGLLGQDERKKILEAVVPPNLTIREGDFVDIVLAPRSVLRAAWLVYGLPLVLAVLFAGFGWWRGATDVTAVILALMGLMTGLIHAHRKLRTESCLREFTPTVVSRA